MQRIICLILSSVLLFTLVGCHSTDDPPSSSAAETAQATETLPPTETAAPTETTAAPTESTAPTETTQPTEEQRIQETVQSMMEAYLENVYMYTDHSYDSYTVLALSDEQASRTVEYDGQEVVISDFFQNIEFLHDKETYWKYVRKDIFRKDYRTTYFFPEFTADGSFVSMTLNVNIGYQYTDSDSGSFDGLTFDIELLQIDGQWYVCDITEQFSAFDGQYKDDPDFDIDAWIAEQDAAAAQRE